MKITKVEVVPITLAGIVGYTSRGPWRGDFTIVRVYTDEGIIGVGDGGYAKPTHYAETQSSVMSLIHEWLGPAILGEDPFNIEKIIQIMDDVACWNWIAKTGIDYAVHDIVGKKLGIPVWKLIGGMSQSKVPMGWLATVRKTEEMVNEATKAIELGFHSVKIKVGLGHPDDDIAHVKAIRDAVGSSIPLTVDANQAWTVETALRTIKKLERFDLYCVEQPIPDWDLTGLRRLRKAVGVPIMADEAARSIEGLINVIRADAADMLSGHISKIGGLFKSRQYASIAEAAGLPLVCGTMIGTGIECAAGVHFTAAVDWMRKWPIGHWMAQGPMEIFDTMSLETIKEDVIMSEPRIEKGYIYPPDGPGLGVEINEAVMRSKITPGKKPLVAELK